MSITKNVLLNWYSSMKKKLRKIRIIFEIENWLWKWGGWVILHFLTPPQKTQFSKFNIFLWVCWFLGKNPSNFVPPVWKLHNPYCHTQQPKWQNWWSQMWSIEQLYIELGTAEWWWFAGFVKEANEDENFLFKNQGYQNREARQNPGLTTVERK